MKADKRRANVCTISTVNVNENGEKGVAMQMVMGMGEEQFGKLSTAASCQHFSTHTHTPQITHLALKTSSCSAPPPGHCELCVSLQEPSLSRNDSECEFDDRWRYISGCSSNDCYEKFKMNATELQELFE